MLKDNKKIGSWGEQLAQDFLFQKGYQVVQKNWQRRLGEIDLIVSKGYEIVFVEVKTRTTPYCGWAEEAVGSAKKGKIRLLIDRFLAEEIKYQDYFPRCDILVVELLTSVPKFIHYENVLLT